MKYFFFIVVFLVGLFGCSGPDSGPVQSDNLKTGVIVNDSIIYIGRVEAFDPDGDRRLKYTIVEQRYPDMFKINNRGIVYVTKQHFNILNRFVRYRIRIAVEDTQGLRTEKVININVRKTQDV